MLEFEMRSGLCSRLPANPGLEAGALLPPGGASAKCCAPAHRLHFGFPDLSFYWCQRRPVPRALLERGAVQLSLL